MKNKLYYTYVLLFATLFLTSCEQEILKTSFGMGEEVKLTLRLSSDELKSRAEAGDDTYNENAITKVDLYLYPTGGAGQALHKVSDMFSGETEVQLTATLSNDLVDDLFDANGKCHAYALVNYPDTAPDANTDASIIANLKAMDITATFNNETGIQTSFVMDGETNEIEYNASTLTVKGEVQVNRAASKIALFVTGVDKTVTDDAGNVWEPDYTAMDISFHNGVNKAKVDVGYAEGRPNNPNTTDNYYDTSGIRDITADLDKTKTTELIFALNTTHIPFYSYSSDWGRTENPDTEPTITLMVPWRKVRNYGDQTDIPEADRKWQTCYYQIPINVKSTGNSLTNCLERNMYYTIMFHVGILGDFNPPTPTIVNASYYTVPWEAEDVDVNVKNYKYLVVDKNDVTVYNEKVASVAYISSDAVSAEIKSITKPNYSGRIAGTTEITDFSDFTLSWDDDILKLSHELDNDNTSSTFDYVPYTVTVELTNQSGFKETIVFTQYPAMYITVDLNSDYNNDNNTSNDNNNRGYAWVNNSRSTLGNLNGYSTSNSNSNPNMITITTTAFSDNKYVIGDPRVTDINNLDYGNNWASAPALYETSPRRLTYYYPTATDDTKASFVSPKFRIASSYGLTSGINMTDARRRCASYQEDGYPAGRWRVPTAAEIKYIVQLSAKGYITILFNNNGNYWAADGTIYVPNYTTGVVSQGSGNSAFVRCVYDEWYWGSDPIADKTKFTWGDKPRN